MGVLLDQGTPAPLRRELGEHSVATAYERGWAGLTNGELLAAAEGAFDVLVTTDQNLRYQQNLSGRRLAILVLPTTSWPRLRPHAALIAGAVASLRPGELRELSLPDERDDSRARNEWLVKPRPPFAPARQGARRRANIASTMTARMLAT